MYGRIFNGRLLSSFCAWSSLLAILLESSVVLASKSDEYVMDKGRDSYALEELVTVECLNRTTDTGEHITDDKGELQYIPFPNCNETGKPLAFPFGSEKDINCTLDTLPDPLFHLFEFYIHNDAPLSCRMPSLPLAASQKPGAAKDYTNLQFALTGNLQLSHLHINPSLNVIIHTTSPTASSATKQKRKSRAAAAVVPEGQILAATAYSLPPTLSSPRLVIGDPLPFQFSVRWYSARSLPPSTARLAASSGLGGHVHFSTVVYCLLSFGGGIAVSLAYWRGVELPQRMRRYGAEKLGMGEAGRGGYAFPGKRD